MKLDGEDFPEAFKALDEAMDDMYPILEEYAQRCNDEKLHKLVRGMFNVWTGLQKH